MRTNTKKISFQINKFENISYIYQARDHKHIFQTQRQLYEVGAVVLPEICHFRSGFANARRDNVVQLLRYLLTVFGLSPDFVGSRAELEGMAVGMFHYCGFMLAFAILLSCLLLLG